MEKDQLLQQKMLNFLEVFELVFDHDWQYTRDAIVEGSFIAPRASFVEPGVEDEDANWGNRGALLIAYRDLLDSLVKQGLWPVPPEKTTWVTSKT
jgi:hypothetical protein